MIPSIQERFIQNIRDNRLFQKDEKILLAVSGGADSMVLCHLFLQAGFPFGIAHCNFQLRESEADSDEVFVKEYAQKHHVPFHHISFSTIQYAKEHKLSVEEAARNLRYEWFEKIRQENNYQYIATAHHQNDNAETLLLNLFRGTGIRGLHGIFSKRNKIIRPLLFLSKADVLQFAKELHISFVTDSSNASTAYTRNYVRHEIVPVIEKRFPDVLQRLNDNITRMQEAEQLYDQAVAGHISNLVQKRGNEIFIPILKLQKSRPLATIAYELFKNYGFSYEQSRQVLQLADKTPGKVVQSASHQVLRDRKWFIISPLTTEDKTYFVLHNPEEGIATAGLTLQLTLQPVRQNVLSTNNNIATLDADKIEFPLMVRRWKKGDYFYPLGMPKKKKLSRFFIDQKLSLNDKEKVWVLLSGQRIVWVIGMRIDDRFKLTSKTKMVLEIKSATSH